MKTCNCFTCYENLRCSPGNKSNLDLDKRVIRIPNWWHAVRCECDFCKLVVYLKREYLLRAYSSTCVSCARKVNAKRLNFQRRTLRDKRVRNEQKITKNKRAAKIVRRHLMNSKFRRNVSRLMRHTIYVKKDPTFSNLKSTIWQTIKRLRQLSTGHLTTVLHYYS